MYKQVDEARAARLSAKLQANATDNKKLSEIGKDEEMIPAAETAAVEGEQNIQVDGDEENGEKSIKKVSTSGPRQAGRRQWKEKKGISVLFLLSSQILMLRLMCRNQ